MSISLTDIFSLPNSNSSDTHADFFRNENKRIIIAPVQIIAALTIIAGIYALLFELQYYQQFQFNIYWGRLLATAIGFATFTATYFDFGKRHPEILVHILLLAIIFSFASIIIIIPNTLFINSQILSLIIFTSSLFLSWDLKNQIIVAIYYNMLFAFSILLSDQSIYYLPNIFGTVIFIMFVSIMSVFANAINFNLRRKVLQKTLEAKEIFENSNDGLFRISASGELITFNKSFAKILLDGNNELDVQKVFRMIPDFDLILEEAVNSEELLNKEIKLNNSNKYLNLGIWNAEYNDKQVISLDGSLTDITEKILSQKKIQQYTAKLEEINSSKDKFFSIVSHDLKSPFTALLGYSDIILRDGKSLSNDEILNYSKIINNVAKDAFHLLENLLDWSRIQTGRMKFEPQNYHLKTIIDEITGIYKTKAAIKGIKIFNQIDTKFEVYSDLDMLQIIVNNLISNAINFNKEKGVVNIFAESIDEKIHVSIEDTGIGIKEDGLNSLFKIDVHKTSIGQAANRGSGLGLIMVKSLVENNGGEIFVKSTSGKGSVFTFSVPAAI